MGKMQKYLAEALGTFTLVGIGSFAIVSGGLFPAQGAGIVSIALGFGLALLAGLYAFSGILLALRYRDRSGKGQHVDIALYDAILSTLSMPAGVLQSTGREPMRLGNDHSSIAPYEVFACADGTLMVAAANGRLWKQLCAAIGRSSGSGTPRGWSSSRST